jgi:gliding motility-associated-like protein
MYLKQIFILFLFSLQQIQSQVPPEVCARLLLGSGQDSITWDASPCAIFGGYVVLGQENGSGPFIPLDTVFSPDIANPNTGETLWNYQVGMICNGSLTNLSVVVSNQRPVTPNLSSVSIINNVPVVNWEASPSPEVNGYQLYKENPYGSGNFFPYPTSNSIQSGTSFNDINTGSLLVRYAIVAVSPCNKSLLGIGNAIDGTTGPHTSMVVSGNIDTCAQEIALNWNAYENWLDGVLRYEILLSKNGSGFTPYDTVSGSSTSYIYKNAQDNDLLIFQIRSTEQNKNNNAVSNSLTFNVRVNRPMDFLHITGVSVNTSNEVEIEWDWDTDVDFASAEINRGTGSLNLILLQSLLNSGTTSNSITDNNSNPDIQSYYYQISSTDECNHTVVSNLAKTILLKAEALDNFENKISWSAGNIEYGTVQSYMLYKIINGSPQLIATLQPGTLFHTDILDVSNEAEAENCYFVRANILLNFPDGQSVFTQSQSNKNCIRQASKIHIPNAVSPSGKNRYFRPVIVFSQSISDYTMLIFDRYGQQIFESTDLYKAWNGTMNGAPIKTGVYVYAIRFRQPNGEWMERQGTVMLIR